MHGAARWKVSAILRWRPPRRCSPPSCCFRRALSKDALMVLWGHGFADCRQVPSRIADVIRMIRGRQHPVRPNDGSGETDGLRVIESSAST
jgi:hypothetical protein